MQEQVVLEWPPKLTVYSLTTPSLGPGPAAWAASGACYKCRLSGPGRAQAGPADLELPLTSSPGASWAHYHVPSEPTAPFIWLLQR